ncbi:aminotransferase [Paraglaciecola marina]|uniref:aminotransferase n=1 Tax=Paraglaciecola marina TaxID=2500157 RepID=UPI00105E33B1|nr:aminotransferase [Paraglaciecola marina]
MSAMIYPTSNFADQQKLCFERAEGVYIFDSDDKKYLEGMSGLWCTALGYGNQELIDAISEQLQTLSFSHLFGGKSHTPAEELASKIAAMVPITDAHVFFGNSGSDANDTHYKMLRYYFNAIGKPEKRKIITRQRAYHGVTVASGSLTSLPVNLAHFDAPLDALHILRTDAPHYYSGHQVGESETQFVDRILGNLERQILQEGADTIAAMIIEPITGASGVIVPPEGYYQKLQALLRKHDILIWADEVITGFGRTGNDFGCTTMGIKPDLMTFAKQLSSAYYPISASVIPGFMYDAMIEQTNASGVFGHGYTYSGHPVACAAALKTLEIFERDNIFEKAAKAGDYLHQKLATLEAHPLIGEIRGAGLLAAIELVANKEQEIHFKDAKVGAFAQKSCENHGLIVRAVAGNSIALCPPLIISNEQIDEIIEKLTKALDDTLVFAQQQKLLLP